MIDSVKASPVAAGPIPRRQAGESDASLQARLTAWATAESEGLPVHVLVKRMDQCRAAMASSDTSHGADEAIPVQRWASGRDLGDQLAEAMGAPRLEQSRSQSHHATQRHADRDLGDELADMMLGSHKN
jgi:hypothetical protein